MPTSVTGRYGSLPEIQYLAYLLVRCWMMIGVFEHNVALTLVYYLAKYSTEYIVQKPGWRQSLLLARSGNARNSRNED
jgi:hypothetical protein